MQSSYAYTAPTTDTLSPPPCTPQYTADEFNYADSPRPFKNLAYSRPGQGQHGKRNKSLKQILALERERVDRLLEERKLRVLAEVDAEFGPAPQPPAAEGMQVDAAAPPLVAPQPTEADQRRAHEIERRLQEAFHEVVSCASRLVGSPSLSHSTHLLTLQGRALPQTRPSRHRRACSRRSATAT